MRATYLYVLFYQITVRYVSVWVDSSAMSEYEELSHFLDSPVSVRAFVGFVELGSHHTHHPLHQLVGCGEVLWGEEDCGGYGYGCFHIGSPLR